MHRIAQDTRGGADAIDMQQRTSLPASALLVSAIADVERAHPQAIARYGRAFLLVHSERRSDGETGLVDKTQLLDNAPPDDMYAIPLAPRSGAGGGRASGVITIGRLEHNDVFFGDDSVSKLHAIVRVQGGEFFIADAGSKLGTHVDGEPIGRMCEQAERRLVGGETVQLGNVTAMFLNTEGLLVVAGALQ
jgi:pSer/pThr/pTyr-binding forkhead associated (FHA) protein